MHTRIIRYSSVRTRTFPCTMIQISKSMHLITFNKIYYLSPASSSFSTNLPIFT
jgi:hypothetical protein